MDILIFKTDIANRWHVQLVSNIFNSLSGIKKWNVDVEDVDHVLRIEANNLPAGLVEQAVSRAGYYCEEMKD